MIRAFAILFVSATPAMTDPLYQMWCGENETMSLERSSIGFNEHTICEVENKPIVLDENDSWTSEVTCKNVYFHGYDENGDPEIHEMPIDGLTQMTLRGAADGTLIETNNLNDTELHFLPCDT